MDYKVKRTGLTLYTKDKYCEEDIHIEPDDSILPVGDLDIEENGTYNVTSYESVNVNVALPEGYIKPEGEIEIVENGVYDITNYASANVDIKDKLDLLLTDQLEEYSNEELVTLKSYTFGGRDNLKTLNLPNLSKVPSHCITNCKNLINLNLSSVTEISSYGLNVLGVETLTLPNLTSFVSYSIHYLHNLKVIDFPKITRFSTLGLSSCESLETIYLASCRKLSTNSFGYASKITDIYLGYDGLVTLEGITGFDRLTGTKIHVKNSYASQYPDATNWSGLVVEGNVVIIGHFTIGDVDYTAEPTMTWTHWVNSVHNTAGLELITYNGESVIGTTNEVLQDEQGNIIKATDPLNLNVYSLVQKANTSTFTVKRDDGDYEQVFEFKEGMTWEQLINSDYNILNDEGYIYFYEVGTSVYFNIYGGGHSLSLMGVDQKTTDTIVAGQIYSFYIGTGGSN